MATKKTTTKTKAKKQLMSPEEEEIQRALGTLDKFEVSVECDRTTKSFAKVFVTAATAAEAERRAMDIVNSDEERHDDTHQPVSWADNRDVKVGNPKCDGVRFISDDDHMAHRFKPKGDQEEDDDENPAIFGQVI